MVVRLTRSPWQQWPPRQTKSGDLSMVFAFGLGQGLISIPVYLLTAIGFTAGGSSAVHIYTQTIHRTIQLTWEECGPCPICKLYPGIFLTKKEKHGRTLVRVAEECQLAWWKCLLCGCDGRMNRLKCGKGGGYRIADLWKLSYPFLWRKFVLAVKQFVVKYL